MKEKQLLIRILFLDENLPAIRLVESVLRKTLPEFELKIAKTEKEFMKFVIRFQPDIILSAWKLEKYSSAEAFQLIQEQGYKIPFIIITDTLSEKVVNELKATGIDDCIFRSDLTQLPQRIQKALDKKNIHALKEIAEHELKYERGRLQTIFKNTPEAIINVGFKGEILEINPTGLNLLQVDVLKKLERKDIFDFIHPDDIRRYKKFHNSVGIGNKKTEKFKIVGSKKECRWVETKGVPLFNEEEHIISVLTIHKDITEQHEAQELINFHAKLFENISDAVVSFSCDLVIQSWNKGAERIYGWKEKEVVGKKISELRWSAVSEEKVIERFREISASGHLERELNFYRKDGRMLTILISTSAIKNDNGKITGFVGLHSDITERKLAETVIKESELRLKAGQELANLGYWERDLITEKIIWSEQTYKIFEADETENKSSLEDFLTYVHPDDRSSILEAWNKLTDGVDKITHRYRALMKDGRVKHILAVTQLLKNDQGIPVKVMGISMDISDLIIAKENALILEKKFQELFENSPDGIYVEDEDGYILAANQVACKFQGYTKEELVGKNIKDLVPEEFKQELLSRFALFSEQDDELIESFVWDRNMNPTPVEIKTNSISYNGMPALLVHARDISKRRIAETEKLNTDLKFNALTEQAPVAIYHVDRQGKFIDFNKKFLEIFDITTEELERAEWKFRIHPDDLSMFMKLREETMGTDKQVKIQYRLFVQDKIKYVFGTSNALLNSEGELIGRIGTILDITENVMSKEKIVRTQTMLQSLFEHSPDSIFIEDLNGNILNANSRACKLQGMEYDDLVGKNIIDLVPESYRGSMMQNHKQFCEGTLQRLKVSVWNKDGKETPVEIRANLVNYFDSVALLLHVSTLES